MTDRPKLIGSSQWRERPVFLIGGGPSAGRHVESVRGRGLTIAINDCFRRCPWADGVFTIDDSWLHRRAPEVSSFAGALIAAIGPRPKFPPPAAAGACEMIERREGADISLDPAVCYYGENSGFGALNCSVANGAGRNYPIVLLGFDMGSAGHWHAGYEWRCRFGVRDYPRWVKYFEAFALAVKSLRIDIVNLNSQSAIKCFRFAELEAIVGSTRGRAQLFA